MSKEEILEQIKKWWEVETGLTWDQERWQAMEEILTTKAVGLWYLCFLIQEAIKNSQRKEKTDPGPKVSESLFVKIIGEMAERILILEKIKEEGK